MTNAESTQGFAAEPSAKCKNPVMVVISAVRFILYSIVSIILRIIFTLESSLTIFYGVFLYFPLILTYPLQFTCLEKVYWYFERMAYNTLPYSAMVYQTRRGYKLKVSGDHEKLKDIIENYKNECCLVFVNHQSLADIGVLIQNF